MLQAMAIGTFLMLITMLSVRTVYRFPLLKILTLAVTLALAGYLGAMLMALIESGQWGGRSFFGALFFAPLLMIPVSLLLRLPMADVLDQCAPAECIMLMLLKIQCYLDGCCYGMVLRYENEKAVRFPSQAVESVHALVLTVVLVILIRRGKIRGTAYPWYMILYGISRFILNLLRETSPFIFGLPAGNFWSLVSIAIGVLWIVLHKKNQHSRAQAEK